MKPLTAIKWEFLRSAMHVGVPKGMSPELNRWLREFEKPLLGDGYSRFINRFEIGTTVGLNGAIGMKGGGFIRDSANKRHFEMVSVRSRKVMDVVASVLQGLSWLVDRTGMVGLKDAASCEMQISKMRINRTDAVFRALEVARDWLVGSGVLMEGKNLCRFSGERGLKGFRFRCAAGWVHSPMAMLVALTTYKLVMIDPSLVSPSADPLKRLEWFLAWYKGRDDDARLAHRLLREKGVPHPSGVGVYNTWKVAIFQVRPFPEGLGYLPRPSQHAISVALRLVAGGGPASMTDHEKLRPHVPEYPPPKFGWGVIRDARLSRSCNGLVSQLQIYCDPLVKGAMYVAADDATRARLAKVLGGPVLKGGPGSVTVNSEWLERTPGAAKRVRRALLMLPEVAVAGHEKKIEGAKPKPKLKLRGRVLHKDI